MGNDENYFMEMNEESNLFDLKNNSINEKKEDFKLFENKKKDYTSIYNKRPIFKKEGKNIFIRKKYRKDNMRKRIKSDLYKEIKKQLNNRLRKENIKDLLILEKLFDWPQSIITNVTKEENKKNLRKTLEQMLSNGGLEYKSDNYIKNQIFENNTKIINIIRNNNINCFDKTFNVTMEETYYKYLKSDRFEESIEELIKEGNNYEYIQNYIDVANDFLLYYNNYKEKNKINNNIK